MNKVAVVKCKDYNNIKTRLKRALDLIGGIDKYIKPGMKVLLKPNMCCPLPPSSAANTNPDFLREVIKLVRERKAIPIVGDCSAGTAKNFTSQCYNISGFKKVCESTSTPFVNFQDNEFIGKSPDIKSGVFYYAKSALEADLIINLPKLKSHGLTFITGAVKNCYGLLKPSQRQEFHKLNYVDFCKSIVDSYLGLKPQLNIMDAIIGMEGKGGPLYGNPVRLGYIIASRDGVAVDSVAAILTKHKPFSIPTIRIAKEKGIDVNFKLIGDKVIPQKFDKHPLVLNSANFTPVINKNKCTDCKVCEAACPVDAISDNTINNEKCIRCLCCYEVCAFNAIELVKTKHALLRLMLRCNQECEFCSVAYDKGEDLTTEEVKQKISELAKSGVSKLVLSGGEPTLRKDLPILIRFAKSKGIRNIELQTNGTKSSNNLLSNLKNAGLNSVLIAIHSHRKSVSNDITHSKLFNNTLKFIKKALLQNITVKLSFVINKKNYKDMKDYVKFFSKLANQTSKTIAFYFAFVRPYGRAYNNKAIVPRLSQIEPYLYEVMEHCINNNIDFMVEGVPLCYMIGYEKYSAEVNRMNSNFIYMDQKNTNIEDVHELINKSLKRKAFICRKCSLNNKCPGVWKEYAELFGTNELFPVYHKINPN